jgi:phenylacetate-coenzyme A ligase PaaK-like adenylate-forming protein
MSTSPLSDVLLARVLAPFEWSTEQLREHQVTRLRQLVAHAKQGSAFWRERLGGVEPVTVVPEDLAALPVLEKDTLVECWDDIVTVPGMTLDRVQKHLDGLGNGSELFEGHVIVMTGGTSGVAAVIPFKPDVFDEVTLGMGFRAAMQLSAVTGRPYVLPERFLLIGSASPRYMGYIIPERAGYEMLPATLPLDRIVAKLNSRQPDSLSGYASILTRLAQEQLSGRLKLQLHGLGSTSETLSQEDRELCARAFDVPVRNTYAVSELCFVGSTLGDATFLLNDDHFLVEPLDSNSEPVGEGDLSSSLAVTSLSNWAFPLFRYRLPDRVVLRRKPWPQFPMAGLEDVAGRSGDWLRFGSDEVHPSVFSAPLIAHPGVSLWQVQQGPTGVRVLVVSSGERSVDTGQLSVAITERLVQAGLENIPVTVDLVPAIHSGGHAEKHKPFVPLDGS